MKFVLSFSGGKDSILALHEMVQQGHEAVALLVMYREDAERSWTHGIDRDMLTAMADALNIPLLCCKSAADTYEHDFEEGLREAVALGAEACVFGDIDIELHREWDESRCEAVGIKAVLPLWGCDREDNVRRAVELGYVCTVKCVKNDVLPVTMLGQPLSMAMLEEMSSLGVDLCGENGEYHTVVVDGPLFRHPVEVECCGTQKNEWATVLDLKAK